MPAPCSRRSACRSAAIDRKSNQVATTAWVAKSRRKPKFSSRSVNRCHICGRSRAYLRKFDMCRICFRNRALNGEIPGVRKASW